MDKQKTTVRVAGKEYTLVSADSPEYISRVANYVDRRITPEDMPIQADAPKEELGLLDRVHRLPVKEREVIVMHYWNDMSPEEIAALLSIDRATVFRRLARGRKRLKIELEGGAQE